MTRALYVAIIGLGVLIPSPALRAQSLARIYVYAAWESPYRSSLPISCDGLVVAKVKRGRFFAINASPGQHILSVKDSIPIFVDVKAGDESFVRLEHYILVSPSGKSEGPALSLKPSRDAQNEIINLAYVDAKSVYSTSVSKEDPSLLWHAEFKKRSDVK